MQLYETFIALQHRWQPVDFLSDIFRVKRLFFGYILKRLELSFFFHNRRSNNNNQRVATTVKSLTKNMNMARVMRKLDPNLNVKECRR